MRILYVDVDSLRPDHLGCYGYHRHTSPTIDALAREGVRFDNCYVSDAPCLPSRTALWSGRTGFHTGVVGHGGTAAQPFVEGPRRGFNDTLSTTSWMARLRRLGMRTATISSFAERHSAWHWYAGYMEVRSPGKAGMETADEVTGLALDWVGRNAREPDWFLHVNYWDPHTPYRTPLSYGEPFAGDPPPGWITEEVWRRCWEGYGPHSPQEPGSFEPLETGRWPRWPSSLDSLAAVKRWFDGYDTGIRYADEHLGRLLNALADARVLDETAIVVGADHGECQGELNVWGDHQTADQVTCRVPLVVRWPGIGGGRVDSALHYQFDWAATALELAGGTVPEGWDARPFTAAFREGREEGRPYLVLSQAAWTCARAVRWDDHLCMRTYHDGYKDLEPLMLFDLRRDPHEQIDIAGARPDLADRAMALLADWQGEMMLTGRSDVDPLQTVLRQGGPWQVRGHLRAYAERLRSTGRAAAAERLLARHASDLDTWPQ
ncbi:MAG: sulfatase [Chloroflexi bacterium]|nr:sulfatase [Chloroflexota bacterium]